MNDYVSVWDRLKQSPQFMDEFNKYNKSIGDSLTILKEQKHDIQGREYELNRLANILERPLTPVAALIGQAGVGKSALVEEMVKQISSGRLKTVDKREYFVVSLRIGKLKALGNDNLQVALTSMFKQLAALEKLAQRVLSKPSVRIVLFIDEFHMLVTIFGPGTKIGGDLMKDELARCPIRIIAATTRKEFDATIAVDEPFKERFKEIEMNELPTDVVLKILQNWWKSHASRIPMPPDELFMKILMANKAYRPQQAEPRKSLDILEDLVAYVKINRRLVNDEIINQTFRERFHINLTLDFDADKIFQTVKDQVIGQSIALYTLQRALRAVSFQLDRSANKPILTLLLSGSSGVGKTQTVKAISSVLYPGEDVIKIFNMPDYKTSESEAFFRKRLGETIRHQPNSVILLDEFEKGGKDIIDSMLAILDEGIVNFEVTNREGHVEQHSVSLRNTIIIATTNAGHQVFKNMAEFSQSRDGFALDDKAKAEYEQLLQSLQQTLLANGFKDEMLGRFDRIIPYRNLSENVIIDIAEKSINSYFRKLKTLKGITIYQKEAMDFMVNGEPLRCTELAAFIGKVRIDVNTNAKGARAIKGEIDGAIRDVLIEAIVDNPNSTEFEVVVSRESKLYTPGASPTKGGVIVRARN